MKKAELRKQHAPPTHAPPTAPANNSQTPGTSTVKSSQSTEDLSAHSKDTTPVQDGTAPTQTTDYIPTNPDKFRTNNNAI